MHAAQGLCADHKLAFSTTDKRRRLVAARWPLRAMPIGRQALGAFILYQ